MFRTKTVMIAIRAANSTYTYKYEFLCCAYACFVSLMSIIELSIPNDVNIE